MIDVAALVSAVQIALGLTFALAAATKLIDVPGFVHGTREYRLLPNASAPVAAVTVIIIEGFVAFAMLLSIFVPLAAGLALVLSMIFFVAIWVNLRRGRRSLPCHCFGAKSTDTISTRSLVRLSYVALGSVIVLAPLWESLSAPMWDVGTTRAATLLVMAFAFLLFAKWTLVAPELMHLFWPRYDRHDDGPLRLQEKA